MLTPEGRRAFVCDALVLSLGWAPRDGLLRMSPDPEVCGAGDVVLPGCTLAEAEASGRAAAAGDPDEPESPSLGRISRRPAMSASVRTSTWPTWRRPGTGLERFGDPQAVYDRDDGPVPGRVVLAAPGGVHRSQGRRFKAQGRTTARLAGPSPRLED